MVPIVPLVVPLAPSDVEALRNTLYLALFVPDGEEHPPFSIMDSPELSQYWVDFGERPDDIGRAIAWHSEFRGAAWVRSITGYGYVDDDTPELSIALDPPVGGIGLFGDRLLESLFEDVPRCSLSVDDRNPAVRLFRGWGFQELRRDGEHSLVMLRDAH